MSQTVIRLVRAVVRAFYADEHAVVMDMLIQQKYLPDDGQNHGTLEQAVGFQTRQVRHILNQLLEHGLVCTQQSAERRNGARMKVVYWFINYRHFVRVVLYRLMLMKKELSEMRDHDRAAQHAYICPNCQRGFTALKAVSLLDRTTRKFICDECKLPLEEASSKIQASGNSATLMLQKLEVQMSSEHQLREGIYELLERCMHDSFIPENLPLEKVKDERAAQERELAQTEKLMKDAAEEGKNGANGTTSNLSKEDQSSWKILYTNEHGQQVVLAVQERTATAAKLGRSELDALTEASNVKVEVETEYRLPVWSKVSTVTGLTTGSTLADEAELAAMRSHQLRSLGTGENPNGGPDSVTSIRELEKTQTFKQFYEQQEALRLAIDAERTKLAAQGTSIQDPTADDAPEKKRYSLPENPGLFVTVNGVSKPIESITKQDIARMNPFEFQNYKAQLGASYEQDSSEFSD